MYLVVGVEVANGSHRIAKFASPFLARGPLDVRNDDKDDNILVDLHTVSVGFRGLRTKAFDVDKVRNASSCFEIMKFLAAADEARDLRKEKSPSGMANGKELHDVEAGRGIVDLVVGEFATNGSHCITKFTSPFLASGPLDVCNDDEDDDVLA